jgi:uncharacterized protein (TIGR03085 family)
MDHVKASRGFEGMISALRGGPPLFYRRGPMAAPNVMENWIHHEDLRRAHGDGPRPLDPELDTLFWRSLGFTGRIAGRRVKGAGLEIRTPDGRSRVLRDHQDKVVVVGDPGELVLFLSGRKEPAVVETEGSKEAVALVLAARFGL